MTRFMLFVNIWFYFLFAAAAGQSRITFRVDMTPLIEQNIFETGSGQAVYVTGSFSNWEEDCCPLQRSDSSHFYTGIYDIDSAPGDTLEYKFLFTRKGGTYYWESRPDTSNTDHGNRRIILKAKTLVLPPATFTYDEFIRYPVLFSKEKLQHDFRQLRRALEEYHPALYDYTDKVRLDSLFDQTLNRLDKLASFEHFYTQCSAVLSKIGCGHTKLWIPDKYWDVAPDRLFPVKLLFSSGKVYAAGSLHELTAIPIGSELLSINNEAVDSIIKKISANTSADGFNRVFKSKITEKHFSERYALYYGYPDRFGIRFIRPRENKIEEITVDPVDITVIKEANKRGHELSLQEVVPGHTAVLTVNTFIYYEQRERFNAFVDSSFEVLSRRRIPNLILDLRGNDGGDPFCASYLLTYLSDINIQYFVQPYGRDTTLNNPRPPARNYFRGRIFTLIDGNNFSTAGHFTALLKHHNIGQFIGSETGATYTCTGSVKYIDLQYTGLILGTARYRRYTVAVSPMDRRHGIIPDYPVEQTPEDLINGKDTVLDFAIKQASKPTY